MVFRLRIGKFHSFYKYNKRLLLGSKQMEKKKNSKRLRKQINKIGDQQTLFMFILSDQIIILFPADTFSRKQHYKRNKYKLLE